MMDDYKKLIKKKKSKIIKLETIIEEEPIKPIFTCHGKCDKCIDLTNCI